jgi:DNA-binding NtrC family response regulator
LRALALHKLSRIGLRLRGRPIGLSLRAQQVLNEHDWPGNDVELDAALLCAALETTGEVVGERALTAAIGAAPFADSGPIRRQG